MRTLAKAAPSQITHAITSSRALPFSPRKNSSGAHNTQEQKPLAIEKVLIRQSAIVTPKFPIRLGPQAAHGSAVIATSGRKNPTWNPQSTFSHCIGVKSNTFAQSKSHQRDGVVPKPVERARRQILRAQRQASTQISATSARTFQFVSFARGKISSRGKKIRCSL